MKTTNRVFAFFLAFVTLFSVCRVYAFDTPSATDMAPTQELSLSISGEPTTLDFTHCGNSIDLDVYHYIMEGLTRISPEGNATPGIASSWESNENSTIWTFHLRDSKWSDGAPVTADQFRDGWFRALDPKNPSAYAYLMYDILHGEDYAKGLADIKDVGISVLDPKTLRVTLNTPITYFDTLVSMPVFTPIRKELLTEDGTYSALPTESVPASDSFGIPGSSSLPDGSLIPTNMPKPSDVAVSPTPPTFPSDGEVSSLAPLPEDYALKSSPSMENVLGKALVNGPFRIKTWDRGKGLIFEKNPTYWDAEHIYLEKVSAYLFDDITYMNKIDLYKKGKLDLLDYVDPSSYKTIGKTDLKTYPDGSVWYLSFNCGDKALKNKNIRKALSYSIQRNIYLDAAYPSRKYLPATALVAPAGIPDPSGAAYRTIVPTLFKDHDSVLAKQCYKNGLSELKMKTLPPITLLVNKTVLGIRGGEALAAMWKKTLGIKVTVKAVTQSERLKKLSTMKYQITLDGWGPDYPDPMTYLDIFTEKNPMSHANYSNSDYDQLIHSAKNATGKNEKFDWMRKAEAMLMEDMPVCPLYYRQSSFSAKNYIKGIETSVFSPNINFLHSYIIKH